MLNLIPFFLFLFLPVCTTAQTFGTELSRYFYKDFNTIKTEFGYEYNEDFDIQNHRVITYEKLSKFNGQHEKSFVAFYFSDDRVVMVTKVLPSSQYNSWQRAFQVNLDQLGPTYWLDKRQKSIWTLKIQDGLVYVSAVEGNTASEMLNRGRKTSWSQEDKSFFVNNCINSNPANKGNEVFVRPMCECALSKIESRYPNLQALSAATSNDITVIMEECAKELQRNKTTNLSPNYSDWDILKSLYIRTCWEIKFGKICHPPNNDLNVG